MILEENNYSRTELLNKIVLITGGGGGIGFEASRAFAYMGATVIIAEIDLQKGQQAQDRINMEHYNGRADFYSIDITDENQINKLYEYIENKYKQLDVLINNAAVVPMGAVEAVPISDWDLSYAVNLRAPVLLVQKFITSLRNTCGIIAFVPSAPNPYMSAYEIFKTAQVELCNTLSEENVETELITYSIAPGFVKTDTAIKAVETICASMDITSEDFFDAHKEYIVDAEIAGVGYALSVVNAKQYNGKEIMSHQVLIDSGLLSNDINPSNGTNLKIDYDKLSSLFTRIADVFFDQYQNWQKKKLFQKQFILSDFKKQMGIPADSFNNQLKELRVHVENKELEALIKCKGMFIKWQAFYEHQIKLLQGYEKDSIQLSKDTALLNEWIDILQDINDLL